MKFRSFKDVPLSLRNGEQGATAIEYGLIAALIAVALVTVMSTFGSDEAYSDSRMAATEDVRTLE